MEISVSLPQEDTRTGSMGGVIAKIRAWLFAPVDNLPLVYFRVLFGAIMIWEVWRYVSKGWIDRYYVTPTFHFTYYGFDWVRPWPEAGMYLHFAVLALLAACIMLGLFYRVVMPLFFLAFSYIFLLDQTQYLNHFYLICLISFLMIFMPAHRAYALDSRLRPGIRADTAPTWALWMLLLQIGIAYFYGGIAKINTDWLNGEPMRMWMAARTDFPVIGRWFTEEWAVMLFSYGGLWLDLLALPFLLWRRTRLLMLFLLLCFHLTNARLFSIGIFPWLMIATLPLFLAEGRLRSVLRLPKSGLPAPNPPSLRGQHVIMLLLGGYFTVQMLLPLRHWLYPSVVHWSEEGHYLSWHMKLRDKDGFTSFFITNLQTNQRWEIDPHLYLTPRQVSKMSGHPDMILLFAHHLADLMRDAGYEDFEVSAWALASLNGRAPHLLIDPTVNLAAVERNPLRPADWIMPFENNIAGWY